MALRTRIALTFLLLLAAVLAAALGVVSAANHANAEREISHQLDVGESVFSSFLRNNNRLLTQAAQAVALDYGLRDAVAEGDTATLSSVLGNHGERIGADMMVLTSLEGRVIAASGSHITPGRSFPIAALQSDQQPPPDSNVMMEGGHLYQLVAVAVKNPLPSAWIVVGFELNEARAQEIGEITHLGVTLSVGTPDGWRPVISTLPNDGTDDYATRRIELRSFGSTHIAAALSRSTQEARTAFTQLTMTLFQIAAASLVCFTWAAFWIARNITRPLRDLTESVDRMRAGSYDVVLGVQRRDELGVLAGGLQLMQEAVKTRDQSIRRLAYQDALTGLMNRAAFHEALQHTLRGVRGAPVAVAVINLHRFRRINEHLGYSVGDAVLNQIAARLAAVPSVKGSLARLAADQFAAFAELNDPGELQGWGMTLLIALGETILVETQPIDINATIGLAISVGREAHPDDLLRWADLALERARSDKRPFAIYAEALEPAARDQLSLLGELTHAVEHDEFVLYFQPKIDLATQRVAGAEVLLRWQHPRRGLLSPAAFVPFAEQTGFIRRMTRWLLDHAIAIGGQWHRDGKPLALAVNISADDLADPRLDSRLAALLTRHQLPPALLTLELTESGFIQDPERALKVLDALAALGVNLSIDDFGTGYSSLIHLARMPVNELKIDRSFVLGLETDSEFGAIVRAAIDMGHSLGLKVVAEGIENETAAKRLQSLGCDTAQGYHFARPMPEAQLQAWLVGRERVKIIAVPVNFTVEEITDTVNFVVM